MTLKEIRGGLPLVSHIMDDRWLTQKRHWARRYITPRITYYQQLEADLIIVEQKVGLQKLVSCYRPCLRNEQEIHKAIFEIHGTALLASVASQVNLHVSRGDGSRKNFDVQAEIAGLFVNAEAKTRKDEFPFNVGLRRKRLRGSRSSWGTRETLDPHDMADLEIQGGSPKMGVHHIATPESTVIRQILLNGLSQLPQTGCNLILFGHIEGQRRNLEDALYGTVIFGIKKDSQTRKISVDPIRTPTGAFGPGQAGSEFVRLSAVLWIRLMGYGSRIIRAYELYRNPNGLAPLTTEAAEAIKAITVKWTTPTR